MSIANTILVGTPEIDQFSTGCLRKILKVSHKTLVRWDQSGALPARRTESGARVYTRQQIEAFMLNHYTVVRKDGFIEYRPLEPDLERYP
jgi:hypothetical protein